MIEKLTYSELEIEVVRLKTLNEALSAELEATSEFGHAIYCSTCGSCGEEGCCSPTKCTIVKCLYPDSVEKYKEALAEVEQLRDVVLIQTPIEPRKPRVPGSGKGMMEIKEGFDEPL